MDMQIADADMVLLNDGKEPVDMFYGDAEFTFIMTGGDLEIASRQDIWPQANADGITMSEFLTEFLQVGQAIDIDDDAQSLRLHDLVKTDAIGSIQDPCGGE